MYLALTTLVGLFMIIGTTLFLLTKSSKKIINFSTGLGFGILLFLVIFELIPEVIEIFSSQYSITKTIIYILLLISLGIIILKVLDIFIPDHDSSDHNKKHFLHIGIVTSIAILIHNILEGIAVYSSLNTNLNFGILLCIGVGLHNIPLGMFITSSFYKATNNVKKTSLIMLGLSLSTFIGGAIASIFDSIMVEGLTSACILTITIGMLIYIITYELLPTVIKEKKYCGIGIAISLIVSLIVMFLE